MSSKIAYGHAETRRRILQATWELVEERGEKVRLIDAADRAGVSRQAVHLHFGTRTGLLLALVEYMDASLGFEQLIAHVLEAPTGGAALDRLVEAFALAAPKIDSVARMLEAAQYRDEALAAAWRDRMHARQTISRTIVERIAADGKLAAGWTVDAAAALVYAATMPGPWRELTRELGWTPDKYTDNVARLLRTSLVAG